MESSLQEQTTEFAPISGVERLRARAKALLESVHGCSELTSKFGSRTITVLVLLGIGALLYRVSYFERDYLYSLMVDDAYISARHAQNLVEGHGLNFNADERIEGYTNFLFTLFMAIPQLFDMPVEPFVRALGCLTALSVVGLTWRIASFSAGPLVATIVAAALLLDQRFVFFSTWGLETVFTCLPVLMGYFLTFRRQYIAAGLAFAAAAMTRIDMVVVVFPAILYALALAPSGLEVVGESVSLREELRARLTNALRIVVPFGGVFGSYFLTRWYYYGWLLPNTFYAKVGEPSDSWRRGWDYLVECFTSMGVSKLAPAALVAWGGCFVMLGVSRRFDPRKWPEGFRQAVVFLIGALGYLGYILLVGGDHFKERFIYHVFPIILFACVVPFRWIFELSVPDGRGLRRLVWVPSAIYALIIGGALALAPHRFNRSGGIAGWISLGKYLKEVARPGAVLATDAAGALPFYSGLKTIDILGLADVHIGHVAVPHLGSGPAGHEKTDLAYVLDRQPEYISTWLGADGIAGRGFGAMPRFNQEYRLAALVRTDSSEISRERILTIEDPEPSRSELMNFRAGSGQVPGRYDWALYERRQQGSFVPLPNSGFRSNLPGWHPSSDYIVAAKKGHAPAHIMWGPFIRLPAGSYNGYLKLEVGDTTGIDPRQKLCGFDVFDGKTSLADSSLATGISGGSSDRNLRFSFDVNPDRVDNKIEFRLYCWGLADITIDSVFIAPAK